DGQPVKAHEDRRIEKHLACPIQPVMRFFQRFMVLVMVGNLTGKFMANAYGYAVANECGVHACIGQRKLTDGGARIPKRPTVSASPRSGMSREDASDPSDRGEHAGMPKHFS